MHHELAVEFSEHKAPNRPIKNCAGEVVLLGIQDVFFFLCGWYPPKTLISCSLFHYFSCTSYDSACPNLVWLWCCKDDDERFKQVYKQVHKQILAIKLSDQTICFYGAMELHLKVPADRWCVTFTEFFQFVDAVKSAWLAGEILQSEAWYHFWGSTSDIYFDDMFCRQDNSNWTI